MSDESTARARAREIAHGDRALASCVLDSAVLKVIWKRLAELTSGGETELWGRVIEELK